MGQVRSNDFFKRLLEKGPRLGGQAMTSSTSLASCSPSERSLRGGTGCQESPLQAAAARSRLDRTSLGPMEEATLVLNLSMTSRSLAWVGYSGAAPHSRPEGHGRLCVLPTQEKPGISGMLGMSGLSCDCPWTLFFLCMPFHLFII